ncbi:MAG: hypothetical protein LUF92_10545 [Clostridiales bacterium]|nr:hypothetical protein [Clostridiales bacterium]
MGKRKEKEPSIFRQEMKRDWNTFKRLSGKKKLGFFWDYYKLPTALILTLIICVCVFAHMLWEGQRPCRLRVCVVLNTEESCSYWFNNFISDLQQDGAEGDVDVNEDQPFDYDNSYYYLYEMEVMTQVSAQRIDVAICNADMYEYLLALNACATLDTFLPEELYNSLLEKEMLDYNTANLTEDEYGEVDLSDGIDGCYAINLDGTEFADTYNQTEDNEPLYAVIISNTEHLDDSITLIEALVE